MSTTIPIPNKFYNQIVQAYSIALKRSPDSVESQMLELGDLIASFAPYVGTAKKVDSNDIEQINENAGFRVFQGLPDGFKDQLLRVFNMSQNSFQYTEEAGDLILKNIAAKCREIAASLG